MNCSGVQAQKFHPHGEGAWVSPLPSYQKVRLEFKVKLCTLIVVHMTAMGLSEPNQHIINNSGASPHFGVAV